MEGRNAEKRNKRQKVCEENKLLIVLICLVVLGTIAGTLLLFAMPLIFVKEPMPYRLPENFLPYHYDLELKPYLVPGNFRFEGQVAIYVTCAKITDTIVLHSRNLTIDKHSVSVTDLEENDSVEVLLLDYDVVNDLLILRLLENLKERREYRIHVKYKGILKKGVEGFYITTYLDEDKVTHYVASSHFEPVNARSSFPCFDEPQLKATFNVTLVRWSNMTSLSNMPKLRVQHRGGGWEADIFQKSMKMSTYLVAFIFCDYVGLNKGKITIWAPRHRIKNAEFALNVSHKAMTFFERKLQIPYRAPKLDMVPVSALEVDGMENWGLIIYEQSSLLTPENKSEESEDTTIYIAELVMHEVAHQWFGNLVTMKWWSDIWLNEGMTSYMENLAMLELFPEWNEIDPTIKYMYKEMSLDCTKHYPVWQPVHNSKDASDSFEGVTYPKGGMITRMAHQILGEKVFWTGIRRYLSSNAYGSVEEADLWRYLTAAQIPGTERLDMAEIMYSWTHLSGMPIVMVERDYDKGTATFSQRSCKARRKGHENDRWNIPITIETKYSANLLGKIVWLKKRNMTVDEMPEEDQWIVVNGDSTGLYIVNYDRENWKLIHEQLILNSMVFDATQRYKFLVELLFLERNGDIQIDLLFQHLIYLRDEKEDQILAKVCEFSYKHMRMFEGTEFHKLMKEFFIYIWENAYRRVRLGEDKETDSLCLEDMYYGYSVQYILCGLGYEPCVKDAERHYLKLKDEEEVDMSGSLGNKVAICTVALNMTYEEWKELKDTVFDNETESLIFALECSDDASVIRGELQEAFDNMETLSFHIIYYAIEGHNTSFHETMKFFDENFETLVQRGNLFHEDYTWKLITVKNVSRIQKIIEMLKKHHAASSGSNARNIAIFAKSLQLGLTEAEKKAKILKSWLSTKPWLQFNEFF